MPPETGLPFVYFNAFISMEQCLSFEKRNSGYCHLLLRHSAYQRLPLFQTLVLEPACPSRFRDISGLSGGLPDETFTLCGGVQCRQLPWSPAEYLDRPTCPVTEYKYRKQPLSPWR